jgi:hypothetical protein
LQLFGNVCLEKEDTSGFFKCFVGRMPNTLKDLDSCSLWERNLYRSFTNEERVYIKDMISKVHKQPKQAPICFYTIPMGA